MAYLAENTVAPDFTLQNQDGQAVTLSSLRGRKVVLYFYPRDNTPGCTKQACGFAALKEQLEALNAVIVGISTDNTTSHQKFIAKYNLPFMLLCDEDHQVQELYGVWQQKNMYGKISMGTVRTTYVLDEEGRIIKLYKRARAATNAEDCLKLLQALNAEAAAK